VQAGQPAASRPRATDEQIAAIEQGLSLKGAEVQKVIAFAGAGKTTTLGGIAAARSRLRGTASRGIYLAFNKSIAEEAGPKFRVVGCKSSTLHSLAFRATGMGGQKMGRIDARLVRELGLTPSGGGPEWNDFRRNLAVVRAVNLFCASSDRKLTEDHAIASLLDAVPGLLSLDADEQERRSRSVAELVGTVTASAQRIWRMLEEGDLPPTHDAYLKILDLEPRLIARAFSGIGYIMIDEAQDLNPVQRSILQQSGLPVIAVGDPYQQIYSWRGAENALAQLPDDHPACYLTQSFRFGEKIASVGRAVLVSRPDGGPTQILRGMRTHGIGEWQGPAKAILCRTKLGVIDAALDEAAMGRRVHVGLDFRDIEKDIRSACALRDGRLDGVTSPEIRAFASWDDLVEAAEAGDRTLSMVVKFVEKGGERLLDDLKNNTVQSEREAEVTVSTGHGAKGREWPTVVLADDWANLKSRKMRYKRAVKQSGGWNGDASVQAALEEWNVLYVAATRAMKTVNYPADVLVDDGVAPSAEEERRAPVR
jgi:hypothetical protein